MAALITKSSANLATETSQKKLSYRLHVVPFQLRFDFSPTSHIFCIGSCKLGSRFLDADGDEERNARSAAEWIDAVLSYLEFRAGSKWRRGKARHRQSVRYWEYLDAIRLINEQRYLEQPHCNCSYCLPIYGSREMKPIPALPLLYPGDKFFRANPHLEPVFDERGRYQGARATTFHAEQIIGGKREAGCVPASRGGNKIATA